MLSSNQEVVVDSFATSLEFDNLMFDVIFSAATRMMMRMRMRMGVGIGTRMGMWMRMRIRMGMGMRWGCG